MRIKIGLQDRYSTGRIEKSDAKFRTNMIVNKRQTQSQQKVGVDITPFLHGKIHYGKLESFHSSLVRQEIETQTQQVPDASLGI